MFYGTPGGLSGSGWGTQDANGVWSGWANGGQPQQAAYDPGQGAAFGGAADPYSGGGANAYLAGLPSGGADPVQYSQPAYSPAPVQAPQPSAASFGGGSGPAYSAPVSTASFGGAPSGAQQMQSRSGETALVPEQAREAEHLTGGPRCVSWALGGHPFHEENVACDPGQTLASLEARQS